MKIYRFTYEVYPTKINHLFVGDGVFGVGTYFSLDDRAKTFGNESEYDYTIHTEYDFNAKPTDIITLSEEFLKNVSMHEDVLKVTAKGAKLLKLKEGAEFGGDRLPGLVKKLGYQCFKLVEYAGDEPDGGPQLIVPKGCKIDIKPVSMTIALPSVEIRDQVLIKLKAGKKLKPKHGGFCIESIPWSKAEDLTEILSSLKMASVASFLANYSSSIDV